MSLMLKTRKGNTVPFGYKLAEDNHSLEPIENELAALEKANYYYNVFKPQTNDCAPASSTASLGW